MSVSFVTEEAPVEKLILENPITSSPVDAHIRALKTA